jgi:hypothetical protein
MFPSIIINRVLLDPRKRNFLGRSEEIIREHFQKMGMVLLETQDAKGRRQIEINEFPYYNVRYLLVNNICRWVHEEYIDDKRLESVRKLFNKNYLPINKYSWVEFSPRTDYLHTLNSNRDCLSLNHFLALCFVPAYNLLGYSLKEIKRWLIKNKDVKPELTPCHEKKSHSWMAFWHGVGMVVEINNKGICSRIIFYLPGGYKDFLEELMNEYLVPVGENKWLQDCREMTCIWELEKDTGTEFWELYLTEMDV